MISAEKTGGTAIAVYGIRKWLGLLLMLTVALTGTEGTMTVTRELYGSLRDGREIQRFTLRNSQGHELRLITYGGIVTSIRVPDRQGRLGEVVLGFDRLEDYVDKSPYFGCLVGRYGNRIARGRFVLDGQTYELSRNDGENHLHGGKMGFDKQVWSARSFREADCVGVELSYTSPHGEEGYPGTLKACVTYRWTNETELQIDYRAETDGRTVCNLTHHSYFNLGDGGASPILDHRLQIDAAYFTPVDRGLIPSGKLQSVADTPFDFRRETPIGARINAADGQLQAGSGYDHNFVLRPFEGGLRRVAELYHPQSGRVLELSTTEPGLQFYSGNFLDGSLKGRGGVVYGHRHGLCLETQHFPDSPNCEAFPSTRLDPGQTYRSQTVYRFSLRR